MDEEDAKLFTVSCTCTCTPSMMSGFSPPPAADASLVEFLFEEVNSIGTGTTPIPSASEAAVIVFLLRSVLEMLKAAL